MSKHGLLFPALARILTELDHHRDAGDTRFLTGSVSDTSLHPAPRRPPNRKERRTIAAAARRHNIPLTAVRTLPPPDGPAVTSSGLVDPAKAR